MQKRIICPECKGYGYITLTRMYHDLCGIGSEPCKNCNATGFLEVPMTNADRIRAMSDEELADLFYGFCCNGEHCYECPLYNKDCVGINGVEKWKEWMKQPVELPKEG